MNEGKLRRCSHSPRFGLTDLRLQYFSRDHDRTILTIQTLFSPLKNKTHLLLQEVKFVWPSVVGEGREAVSPKLESPGFAPVKPSLYCDPTRGDFAVGPRQGRTSHCSPPSRLLGLRNCSFFQ